MENITIDTQEMDVDEADQYRTVFFMFDSVIQNGELDSQAALKLFNKIQSDALQ